MSCSIKRHSNCEHTSNSHHVHQGAKSKMDITMNILEKVSAVALGAFSLYTSWKLFTPFFAIGLAIGAYNYFQNRKTCHHQAPGSACSQGFLEQLTGVKLPAPISLVANIAITVCHIDHHAIVFVPIIGLSMGAWVGKMSLECGAFAWNKLNQHKSNHIPAACFG
jgi:hypothetical protein